jgi:hypothetical protein
MALEVKQIERKIGQLNRPAPIERVLKVAIRVTPRSSGTAISPSSTISRPQVSRSRKWRAEQRYAVITVTGDQPQPPAPVHGRGDPVAVYLTSCSQPSPSGGRADDEATARRIVAGSAEGAAACGKAKLGRFCMGSGA